MLEALIIVWGNLFADGEKNVDEGCHSKPALNSSERNMFIWHKSRD